MDPIWLAGQFPDLTDLKPLASGGQKEVYSAIHAVDGPVVIKLMRPGSDPERTARELEAAARISALRVPRVFGQGQLMANTGVVMWFREQRIPGQTLSDRIQTRVLSYQELLLLALHVSETLVAAESAGIVHRDVKPANIIEDPNGEYWLIDFGLARHLNLKSLTATAALGGCGTLGYAPVEQCRNDKPSIDPRADVFALGVTLFEAATGRNPYLEGARDAHEVVRRVANQHLPRLQSPISSDFADLVSTLAQPNMIHRCQTAREANEWIRDLCTKEGVL